MKYTIKDITNGKIGVINDGTLSDLIKVLKEAFNMVDTPSFTGKYKYYFKSSLWADDLKFKSNNVFEVVIND